MMSMRRVLTRPAPSVVSVTKDSKATDSLASVCDTATPLHTVHCSALVVVVVISGQCNGSVKPLCLPNGPLSYGRIQAPI